MMRSRIEDAGVVLIALLWILTALAMIALSFSRETFVEVAAARNTRDLAAAYYAARAGITTTAYRLVQKRLTPRVQQLQLQVPPDPIDMGMLRGNFGEGEYEVEVQDESGKINVNMASEDQLRALVQVIGIDKLDGDIVVDSILDWRDADNLRHANGAEDDYYQTLNPPYKAKNGRLDTVEELLLVRGITRDYFYGHIEKAPDGSPVSRYGLGRYLTVYSNMNRINVNYAPVQVLMTIPGMTPQAAEAIYEKRKTKPFANVDEMSRGLGISLGPNTLPLLSTEQTGVYTLTASAHRQGSKVVRVIRAVITLESPNDPGGYRVIYWNENVPRL